MRGYRTAGILLALSVSICSLTGCGEKKKEADFSGIASVCELATLKCYYHNVAKAETEASGLFKCLAQDIRKYGQSTAGL